MPLRYLILLALPVLFVLACGEDDDPAPAQEPVDLTLNFATEFDNQPLSIQAATYDYPLGEARLKTTLFQYYVSDLELLPADGGDPVLLTEIDLIRYGSEADGGQTSRTFSVPAGNYRGLRFGLGVKPELNQRDPSEFAADFVLNENEFWSPATRYVFAKIEANADLENDDTFDTGLTYHMGASELYRVLTFGGNFSVNASTQLTLNNDLLDAFTDGSATFDISDDGNQRVHGGNQAVATDIWNRLAGSFELTVSQ